MFASRMPSRCAVSAETLRSSSTPTTVSHSLPTLIALADRIFRREEARLHALADDRHRRRRREVRRRRTRAPSASVQVHHVEVARVDADDLAGAVMPFARDDAVDDDFAARRADVGNRRP